MNEASQSPTLHAHSWWDFNYAWRQPRANVSAVDALIPGAKAARESSRAVIRGKINNWIVDQDFRCVFPKL